MVKQQQHSSYIQSPEPNLKSPAREKDLHVGLKLKYGRVSSTENERRFSSTSRRKLLSPCEKFIVEKRQEFKSKLEEASAKRKNREETSAKITDAASALGNTGQRCSIKNCYGRNYTVRTYRVFFCGELSRHLDEKQV